MNATNTSATNSSGTNTGAETETVLFTHAAVRLRAASDAAATAGQSWELVNLVDKASCRVSPSVAMLLVSFMGGSTVADAVEAIARHARASREDVLAAVEHLRQARFLVAESEPSHRRASALLREWARYGWNEAADYHLLTYDYPFVDYSVAEGREQDAELMRTFRRKEPDSNRTKRYPEALARVPVPRTPLALDGLKKPFDATWRELCARDAATRLDRPMPFETLASLTSTVFGELRNRPIPSATNATPLLRKTTPSGGSRHPTEGYVAALHVTGLDRGIYHFNVADSSLDKVVDLPDAEKTDLLLEGPFRARHDQKFEPSAVILLTSVFERNMYRYREPRTLRVVFLDVGHVVSTIEMTAFAHGLRFYPQHGVMDAALEEMLGIDPYREGTVYSVALG